jgi:hypothetical protein
LTLERPSVSNPRSVRCQRPEVSTMMEKVSGE